MILDASLSAAGDAARSTGCGCRHRLVTGQRTGDAADTAELEAVRAATHLPLLVGSGVDETNVAALLAHADGVIVASALKEEGVWWNPVEEARVRAFMEVVDALDEVRG